MSHPWRTIHSDRGLRAAWLIGVPGGLMSLMFIVVVMLAPVQVVPLQLLAVTLLAGVIVSVVRLSTERIEITKGGIGIFPAFRQASFVSWHALASVDVDTTREHRRLIPNTHNAMHALWDIDSADSCSDEHLLRLVTIENQAISLPVTSSALAVIRQAWQLSSA